MTQRTGAVFDSYLSGGGLSASGQIKRWNVFIWPFKKKKQKTRGTRARFLKMRAPWIRLSTELNWSGFCAFFKGSSQVSFSG